MPNTDIEVVWIENIPKNLRKQLWEQAREYRHQTLKYAHEVIGRYNPDNKPPAIYDLDTFMKRIDQESKKDRIVSPSVVAIKNGKLLGFMNFQTAEAEHGSNLIQQTYEQKPPLKSPWGNSYLAFESMHNFFSIAGPGTLWEVKIMTAMLNGTFARLKKHNLLFDLSRSEHYMNLQRHVNQGRNPWLDFLERSAGRPVSQGLLFRPSDYYNLVEGLARRYRVIAETPEIRAQKEKIRRELSRKLQMKKVENPRRKMLPAPKPK